MKSFILGLLLTVFVSGAFADTGTVFYRSGNYMAIRPGSCLIADLTIPAQVIPQGASTAGELLMSFLPRFMTLDEYIASAPDPVAKDNIYVACGMLPPPVVIKKWVVAANGIYLDRPAKELVTDSVTGVQTKIKSRVRYPVGADCDNSLPVGYIESSTGGKQWRFFAGQTQYVVVCEEK